MEAVLDLCILFAHYKDYYASEETCRGYIIRCTSCKVCCLLFPASRRVITDLIIVKMDCGTRWLGFFFLEFYHLAKVDLF